MWTQHSLAMVTVFLCEICACGWGSGTRKPSWCSHCVEWLMSCCPCSSPSVTYLSLNRQLQTHSIVNENKISTQVWLCQTCHPRYSESWGKGTTSSRPAWTTEWIQGKPGKLKETLIWNWKKSLRKSLWQIAFLPCIRPQFKSQYWRANFEVN